MNSDASDAARVTHDTESRSPEMGKRMSPAQIEANRRNARKSTGPKTPAGKAVAKLNALKHGILSREVVVQGWKIRESPSEFDLLRQQFLGQYAPVGPVEEMLVDRIVSTCWRLRRAVTAESGEIALSVDIGHFVRTRPERLADVISDAVQPRGDDAALELEESILGLGYLRSLLENVRAAVEKNGELTKAALQETHVAGKPNALTDKLAALRAVPVANPDGLDEAALKAKRRDQILTEIGRMSNHYECQEKRTKEREEVEESARQAAAVLPSTDTLDKILRYETTLDRQLYRAMNQLERLQRLRQGEAVPPPLTMEVSARC